MKNLLIVALVSPLFILYSSYLMAQDPVKVSPDVYSIKLENDQTRMLEMKLLVGKSDKMHSHPSESVHFIKGGKVEVSFPNGETVEMEIPDDHYMWHEAWTHRVKNIGNTDIHAIIVEEKATDDQPQLYKLYVDRTKSSIDKPRGIELAHEFRKIYEENGVKFVGVWTNINDPQEQYSIL